MRKYYANSTGNCLQCCLAGILDLPLEHVPYIETLGLSPGGWFKGLYDWCKTLQNHVPIAVFDNTLDDLIHIEVVKTLKGVTHAVISKGTTVLHDPDSTAEYPKERKTEYRILFVPLTGHRIGGIGDDS